MRKRPHEFLLHAALQYGGVVRLGHSNRFLVAHPDNIKHVLLDNQHNYIKKSDKSRLRLLIGNGLPISEGEFWMRQRRLMQPAFHRHRLADLTTLMTDITAAMLERWQVAVTRDQSLDIAAEMRRLTREIIVKAMFGVDIDVDEADAVGRAFTVVTEYINNRTAALLPLPLGWPTPRNMRLRKAQQCIDDTVSRLIDRYRQNDQGATDLISMLLSARDAETGACMSDEQLRDEVRTMFFAGYDTTSSALAWTWYLLAKHPSIEHRLQQELDDVLDGRCPTFQDLPQLTYTRMVVEESMRLYPPGWITSRTAVLDDEIEGYHIPKGAKIVLSPYVTHRLPTFWEHPDVFEPERFSPERSAKRHRCAYIPFGIGSRLCIGSNLAMMETLLIVAMVAQSYRLCLLPGHSVQPHPSIILQPRNGIRMRLHPRSFPR
jgi:cytochrome P450